jgi:hypothetical protein
MKVPWQIAFLAFGDVFAPGCYNQANLNQLQQGAKYYEDRAAEIQKAVRETDNAPPKEPHDSGGESESTPGFSLAEILKNMPVNSESRCVGISLVAGALLEGQMLADDGADDPATLAQQIYDGALKKSAVQYRAKLSLDGGAAPIQSREALEKLSTTVADLYKQRHLELIATEKGRQRLRAAMAKVVTSSAELDAVLDADPDKIDTFFCVGMRRFPDGTFKDTNHAILIAKNSLGERVVYDPNDPGEAIPCRVQDIGDGVEVTWKCRYRDTGQVTTQRYQILARESFFRLLLAKE